MGLWEDWYREDMPEITERNSWTTKDGRRIPFADLTTEHLNNIIMMLVKKQMLISLGGDRINPMIDSYLYRLHLELKLRMSKEDI